MEVSVVTTALNDREQLRSCLDALATERPGEVVVVNGPSTDGTTGMIRERDDVDVLVEIDERNVNVARNAGLDRTSGDAIAFLNPSLTVREGWLGAIVDSFAAHDVGAVAGPSHRQLRGGVSTETTETRTIRGRTVTYFNGGNVAFRRSTMEAIDGFDESLETGGARDAAHRLAATGHDVRWVPEMAVTRSTAADGGSTDRDWRWRYRGLTYRLVKNYGPHPTVPYRIVRHAVSDAAGSFVDVARGDARPTSWLGNGRDVVTGIGRGAVDGLRARYRDRTPRRNPRGWSSRADRAVRVYDRR